MELNSFLFPAPQSSYTIHAAIGDLLFIPRDKRQLSPYFGNNSNSFVANRSERSMTEHQQKQVKSRRLNFNAGDEVSVTCSQKEETKVGSLRGKNELIKVTKKATAANKYQESK